MEVAEREVQRRIQDVLIWRRNAPYLYQFLVSNCLTWPSLTVDWVKFQDYQNRGDPKENISEVVVGSQTNGAETNYIEWLKVRVPNQAALRRAWASSRQDISKTVRKNEELMTEQIMQPMQRILIDAEPNRVKVHPS